MSTAVEPKSKTTIWKIDPVHSTAQFKVKHMMISNITGEFTVLAGKLDLDGADITKSRVEASIDATSIHTREPQRDAHLKSADFLDVEKFPTLSFKSIGISRKTDGELEVSGDLTIHGVSRSVVFEVDGPSAPIKDLHGNTRMGLSAFTRIHRKDFGLKWNATLETGGVLVGDEVAIALDIQFVKA
jgi:polyisoprenoid-binding protein YceI